MDQESQKRLADIIAAGPDAISESDAGFLRARSSYLNEETCVIFEAILRGVAVEEAIAQQPADDAVPAAPGDNAADPSQPPATDAPAEPEAGRRGFPRRRAS